MGNNIYSANDARLRIDGSVSLQLCDGPSSDIYLSRLFDEKISLQSSPDKVKIIPWRLPFADIDLYPDDFFRREAIKASGVRLQIRTDAVKITVHGKYICAPHKGCPLYLMDLCHSQKIIATCEYRNGKVEFDNLAEGEKELEIWLSPGFDFIFESLELNNGAVLLPVTENTRPRWVTYGSSITHAIRANSPALTWPAIVARENNWNLLSLGYGGQCKLDPMTARFIRDYPANIISLKLGANVYDGTMSPRSFPAAVIGFISTIREKHPLTPLLLCSPIHMEPWEETPGLTGLTTIMMRSQISEIVEIFKKRGDRNLHYIDGLKLLGPELSHLQPDKIHPDGEGNLRMAENFEAQLAACGVNLNHGKF
jgi:hypothetical protein